MSYVVLARKWRPQTFDDLVGQQHVSRTLANAIASERVAHAFLFTGVRGVGKTTSARILAKALNCQDGPTATPCLVCPSCKEIGDGVDVDVQEIDGASYTGIDAVRSLQETIPYRPARDRFKIYIVDEVHMLSVAAWNAFLKTLEEPPPHVKFIFATTEANKVPVTILSRCQRYDFKLIGTTAIAGRLRHVIDAEKVAVDDDAVRIIAREAAGSMRDAMSLLDQVIAWVGGTGERLTAEGVARVLGVAARSVLHRLGSAIVDGDASSALGIIAQLAEQGYALPNVARDFLHYLRDLVIARVADDPSGLIDLADDELADVVGLAKRSEQDDLSRIYLGFSRSFDDIVRSSQPRGALEMALVRLARRPPLLPLDELLRRLAELEQRLNGGGSPEGGQRAGGQGTPPGTRSDSAGARRGGGGRAQNAQPASASPPQGQRPEPNPARPPTPAGPTPAAPTPAGPTPAAPSPAGPTPAAPTPAAPTPAAPTPAASTPRAASTPPAVPTLPAQRQQPRPHTPSASASAPRREGTSTSALPAPQRREQESKPPSPRFPTPQQPPQDPKPPALGSPTPPATALRKLDTNQMKAWRAILSEVAKERPAVASVFEHAAPLSVLPGKISLGYAKQSFLLQQATEQDALELLGRVATSHFGQSTEVMLDESDEHASVQTVAQENSADQAARVQAARKRVEDHPLVGAAMDILGAELRDVRLPSDFA